MVNNEIERLSKAMCQTSCPIKNRDYDSCAKVNCEYLVSARYIYNGGYNRALDDLAERLTKFYGVLKGKTVGGTVEYHIKQIAKELRRESNNAEVLRSTETERKGAD